MKPKHKGNNFERKIARQLSEWMFNDINVLKRHPTSGGDKSVLCGDIIPLKQLPSHWNEKFPFFVEVKTGYEKFKPTFWNFSQVEKWFVKSWAEHIKFNQEIIFLICQFKNMKKLLFTNYMVYQINPKLCFPCVIEENMFVWVYAYLFDNVLELDFKTNYEFIFNKGGK